MILGISRLFLSSQASDFRNSWLGVENMSEFIWEKKRQQPKIVDDCKETLGIPSDPILARPQLVNLDLERATSTAYDY